MPPTASEYTFIQAVANRTVEFLRDEVHIQVKHKEFHSTNKKRLKMRYITTLLSIGGHIKMNIGFSFEKKLMDRIFDNYTSELSISNYERQEYMEETAGDLINIIVGNETVSFQQNVGSITLSPPVMLCDATSISRHKGNKFHTAILHTFYGKMVIFLYRSTNTVDS